MCYWSEQEGCVCGRSPSYGLSTLKSPSVSSTSWYVPRHGTSSSPLAFIIANTDINTYKNYNDAYSPIVISMLIQYDSIYSQLLATNIMNYSALYIDGLTSPEIGI